MLVTASLSRPKSECFRFPEENIERLKIYYTPSQFDCFLYFVTSAERMRFLSVTDRVASRLHRLSPHTSSAPQAGQTASGVQTRIAAQRAVCVEESPGTCAMKLRPQHVGQVCGPRSKAH